MSDLSFSNDIKSWFKNGDPKNHILNEHNIYITAEWIECTLKKYGLIHKVNNLALFQTAMIHISYMNRTTITEKTAKLLKDVIPIDDMVNALPLQNTSYGTLEYLGDSVIHYAIADYLFDRYPDEDEGFLTKLRTKLEKAETLSELSKKVGFHKYAIIARNVELSGGRLVNVHLTEDIFESFFGALSKDLPKETSFIKCKNLFIKIIETELDIAELIHNNDNYKDRLMQYFHKMKWSEPKYIEDPANLNKDVPPELRKFIMYVKNPSGQVIGKGDGSSKSKAEQNSAESALITLGVINLSSDNENDNDYYGEVTDDDNDDVYENESEDTEGEYIYARK